MLDFRLYRLALLGGVLAAIVLMFSVVSRPEPLRSEISTAGFDGPAAAQIARSVIDIAPQRVPGSADDGRAADYVGRQLAAIEGASVNEHRFKGTYNGDDIELRNVVATLPGQTNTKIVIAAPRDCPAGVCAASSAASTGALIELGRALAGAQLQKTVELVSLDGSSAGAAGAAQLADELRSEPARAVIVLYQPGSRRTRGNAVIPFSDDLKSTSAQLTESATRAVQAERVSGSAGEGTLSDLLRLAIPAATGDQGPLIGAGSDAVTLASAGDLPLPEEADGSGALDADTLGEVGRSALGLAFALDASGAPLDHGPTTYIPLAGKLIPGWALSLLALMLLLPVGVLGADACVRSWRRGDPVLIATAWVLSRAACFLAAVLAAYALAIVSIVPHPSWPFDPAAYRVGFGEMVVLALLAGTVVSAILGARRFRLLEEANDAISSVIAAFLFAGGLGIWVANPYLALLLVPTVHLWLLASGPENRGRPLVVVPAALGGLVVPVVAALALGDRLDSGTALPWHLVLMFTGGHFGFLATIPLCLLAGCLMSILVVAATHPVPPKVIRRRSRNRRSGSISGSEGPRRRAPALRGTVPPDHSSKVLGQICEYQVLMINRPPPITPPDGRNRDLASPSRRKMSPSDYKTLIASGEYRPRPDLVAKAMLQRRGVRTMLGASFASGRAGHTQPGPAQRPRSA